MDLPGSYFSKTYHVGSTDCNTILIYNICNGFPLLIKTRFFTKIGYIFHLNDQNLRLTIFFYLSFELNAISKVWLWVLTIKSYINETERMLSSINSSSSFWKFQYQSLKRTEFPLFLTKQIKQKSRNKFKYF